ncbi:hypothetical protein J2T08_000558 [Neorhizobium galegae]|uniref:hypothetical protein n=1 Tax=Neorhizobium galegae TaxID=399 RepID=UPI002782B22A|nr:hypothetical protein [Neorhizobium galegae]MDQ0132657.1 hypothetical protein [Neorhizobium galegae]
MKVKTPKLEPDPELERQKAAAAQEKVNTIQDRLSTETDQALRYFGTRRALAGTSGRTGVMSLAGV